MYWFHVKKPRILDNPQLSLDVNLSISEAQASAHRSISESKCRQNVPGDHRNILLAINLVGDGSVENGTAQITLPEQIACPRIHT